MHDVSGKWHGLFSYPHTYESTGFVAELLETDGMFTGSIAEQGLPHHPASRDVISTVDGRRSGTAVAFLKSYEHLDDEYDAVSYEGTLDAEGLEIAGTWSTPGSWSGTFLMIRQRGLAVKIETGVAAAV